MKHAILWLCLVALTAPLVLAGGLCTDSSNWGVNVLESGFYCTLGPLMFQEFTASASGYPPGWGPFIAIGPGVPGNYTEFVGNRANIYFQTNFNTNLFSFRSVSFSFQVLGTLYGIDTWIGGDGTRSLEEDACSDEACLGTVYGSLTVDQDNTDEAVAIPPSTDMWVVNQISLYGASGSRATMSEFSQSFTVPEPLTVALVGTGLLGLGLRRLRMRG